MARTGGRRSWVSPGFTQQGSTQLAALQMLCQHTHVGVSLARFVKAQAETLQRFIKTRAKDTLKKTKDTLFS